MKKILFTLVIGAICAPVVASAAIPVSAITSMKAYIYGAYVTSDPKCTDNLVAVKPMTVTPVEHDMLTNPTIGEADLPIEINCVVMVMKNQVPTTWAAGTYTGSDSSCNAGGTDAGAICGNVATQTTISYPAKIAADMTAVGLTAGTTCTTSTSDIVPLYISTYSKCYMQETLDAAITGCVWVNGYSVGTTFVAPTAADSANGVHLTAPAVSNAYRFVIDPTGSTGDRNGTCTSLAPPLFSFRAL